MRLLGVVLADGVEAQELEAGLDAETVDATLGLLLKYQDDVVQVQGTEAARLLAEIARLGETQR